MPAKTTVPDPTQEAGDGPVVDLEESAEDGCPLELVLGEERVPIYLV